MTTTTDIVNLALQTIGSRSTVSAAELVAGSTNEAIQANLILEKYRDRLLRMAPWKCAFNYANLAYISSIPGTPENSSAGTQNWAKGQPAPPWAYEYQYPVDCLKACFIVPQFQTGFSGGVPITTAVTGGAPAFWQGPPAKFDTGVDQFYPVTAAAVSAGGTGYAVGDLITLASGATTSAPIGAPAVLRVATLAGSAVATATVVNQIAGSATPQGGSYFVVQTNPVAQGSTTGSGTGATFNLTFGAQGDQRVILTNQQNAILAYTKQVTDPNVMDPSFIDAWQAVLAGRLAVALTGDKELAKLSISEANRLIIAARADTANEALNINDVIPDWIRIRGVNYAVGIGAPNQQFDWGGLWGVL